jgi:ribosomal protein S14
MASALPRPRESFTLLCVRCGASLYYVRQDRARDVLEHRFECRRCGQWHAAWRDEFELHPLRKAEQPK